MENPSSDDLQMVDSTNPSPAESLVPKLLPKTASHRPLFSRPWFVILLTFLIILLGLGVWISVVGYQTYSKVQGVTTHAKATLAAFDNRDLVGAQGELAQTKSSLDQARSTFGGLRPLSVLPFLGGYLKDADHVLSAGQKGVEVGEMIFAAITPYADIMGFTGVSIEDLSLKTAEDRIIFVAETVEKIAPEMDKISLKLNEINADLQTIKNERYPQKLFGKEVRSNVISLKNSVSSAASSLQNFQPIIKLLPDLLGNPDPRQYLIIFQNDAELRPTGGFLTAYATLKITKGKIEPGVSEDIYTLDAGFKKKVPAPDPIKKYLPLVYNWNLRDMNLSPDFKVSMDTFTTHMRDSTAEPEYDALIAIDTQVPVRILEVLGPIGVPGYGGQFSAEIDPRCDCPQVIYALENIITRPTYEIREGRKSILGPLMNSMLQNMMGSPKAKWAEFFNIFTDSIKQKHLLMYFKDETRQTAVESLGAAGRINSYPGDYLHINDTNFAGAKSNMFVENEVDQTVTINADGSLTKKLILTYKNPRAGDNCNLEAGQLCLNGLLRDWIRIYVPSGSTFQAGRGFEADMVTNTDLGYTVFEGFFTLAPQSVKKLEVEYTVPAGHVEGEYKLLIQKQPGTKEIKHTLTLNGAKPKVYQLNSDQEIVLPK